MQIWEYSHLAITLARNPQEELTPFVTSIHVMRLVVQQAQPRTRRMHCYKKNSKSMQYYERIVHGTCPGLTVPKVVDRAYLVPIIIRLRYSTCICILQLQTAMDLEETTTLFLGQSFPDINHQRQEMTLFVI